jgi:hypothetical protein
MLRRWTFQSGEDPLLAGIDSEIRDEIGRFGSTHPFILVRLEQPGLSSQRFLSCKTQEDIAGFVDELSRLPDLGANTLLRGIERALQSEIYEAADALFSWVQASEPTYGEKVYLGLSAGVECPTYWGYPVFERRLDKSPGSPDERLQVLLKIFEAYNSTTGNDATRFVLLEAFAFALSRCLGARGKFAEALPIVELALAHQPRSIHLKAAKHALNLKISGQQLPGRLEKFVGEDSGYLKQFICSEPFGRMEITHNGDVLVCCGHWLPTIVGNFISSPVDDVLNSVKARKIRESVTDGSYKYCNHLDCPLLNQDKLQRRERLTDPRITQAVASGRYGVDGVDQLTFGLDLTCNLSCPSCRTDRIIEKPSEANEKAEAVEKKLYPLLPTVKVLHINPAGELFASKPSRRVLELIDDERCPDLFLEIISNGTLFTEREWNRYPNIHDKVWSVRISTDAATKETFEKLRRLGRYEVFIENMKFLSRLRSSGKIGLLFFSFTYQLDNFREMRDFAAFTSLMNGDFAQFERLQNMGAFSEEEYRQKAVHRPEHPLYNEFLAVIDHPMFRNARRVVQDFDFFGRQGPTDDESRTQLAMRNELKLAFAEFRKTRTGSRNAPFAVSPHNDLSLH